MTSCPGSDKSIEFVTQLFCCVTRSGRGVGLSDRYRAIEYSEAAKQPVSKLATTSEPLTKVIDQLIELHRERSRNETSI